jgi:hypothetical protein
MALRESSPLRIVGTLEATPQTLFLEHENTHGRGKLARLMQRFDNSASVSGVLA